MTRRGNLKHIKVDLQILDSSITKNKYLTGKASPSIPI